MEREIKGKLLEQLNLKLDYWLHLPYLLLGTYCFKQNDTPEKARLVAQACLQERDNAIAAGKGNKLHRVALRLCVREDLPYRQDLEASSCGVVVVVGGGAQGPGAITIPLCPNSTRMRESEGQLGCKSLGHG